MDLFHPDRIIAVGGRRTVTAIGSVFVSISVFSHTARNCDGDGQHRNDADHDQNDTSRELIPR